jgi:hypothetical protein
MTTTVKRFAPDTLVINPTALEWEKVLRADATDTRQLVVCTKPSLQALVFPEIVKACARVESPHVIRFVVIKNMMLQTTTFEGPTLEILHAYFAGAQGICVDVVDNQACLWAIPDLNMRWAREDKRRDTEDEV